MIGMDIDKLSALLAEVKPSLAGHKPVLSDSLADDLGLDSLDFLQLGRRIQRSAGIPFVMQEWLEKETARSGKRYTLDSLLKALGAVS